MPGDPPEGADEGAERAPEVAIEGADPMAEVPAEGASMSIYIFHAKNRPSHNVFAVLPFVNIRDSVYSFLGLRTKGQTERKNIMQTPNRNEQNEYARKYAHLKYNLPMSALNKQTTENTIQTIMATEHCDRETALQILAFV